MYLGTCSQPRQGKLLFDFDHQFKKASQERKREEDHAMLALKSLLCRESNPGPLAFCAGMLTTTPQDRAIEIKHANGPHSGM